MKAVERLAVQALAGKPICSRQARPWAQVKTKFWHLIIKFIKSAGLFLDTKLNGAAESALNNVKRERLQLAMQILMGLLTVSVALWIANLDDIHPMLFWPKVTRALAYWVAGIVPCLMVLYWFHQR